MARTAGLDVGGAHLKVALVEDGRVADVRQLLCPLWQGLDKLDAALADVRPLVAGADRVAITMTGELSDLFPDRATGVATLVARLEAEYASRTRYWLGSAGFADAATALDNPALVGSTNFLATADAIGQRLAEPSLLVDFGSTTTDIIRVRHGRGVARGLIDTVRQMTGELVYTGYTRTAVMGVASEAPIDGRWVTFAREYLATMGDIRRILGVPLDGIDLHATADGKGKSRAESLSRFARHFGCDAREVGDATWVRAAEHVRELQLRSIADGMALVLSMAEPPPVTKVVAAGIGAADVARVARRFGLETVDFGVLVEADEAVRAAATHAAPAVAVALLVG